MFLRYMEANIRKKQLEDLKPLAFGEGNSEWNRWNSR